MDESLSLKDWLAQNPLPEEIMRNEDGSEYLSIEVVEPKLDYLCPTWDTENFSHFLFIHPFGGTFCSGNVELIVEYKEYLESGQYNTIKRRITGSATFDLSRYNPNMNWGAICLSLCTVSAAKKLGRFFGKYLNKGELTVPTEQGKKLSTPSLDKLQNTINKLNVKKTS